MQHFQGTATTLYTSVNMHVEEHSPNGALLICISFVLAFENIVSYLPTSQGDKATALSRLLHLLIIGFNQESKILIH